MSDAEYTKKIDAEKKKNCIEGEFIVSENSTPHPWSNDPSKAQKQQNQYIESIISKESSRYYFFDGEKINKYEEVLFPHSLGLFYTAITQYLGFLKYGDEYIEKIGYGKSMMLIGAIRNLPTNALLADEMGLGKTVQTLAYL